MIKLTILAAFVMTACSAAAAVHAVVAADNFYANGGMGAPIFYLQPGTLAPVGQNIFVQVLGGAVGSPLEPLSDRAGRILTITIGIGGAGPGFFDAGGSVVPGVAPGSEAQFQVRAWQGTNGFANARYAVASPVWTQATGSWNDNIMEMVAPGLQIPVASLTIVPVPGPVIVSAPENAAWFLGQSNALVLVAFGSAPLSYQWSKNGVPITGATNATLSFTATQFTDGGVYTATIWNSYASVSSPPATITVTTAGLSLGLAPKVTITGVSGRSYTVQYTTNLTEPVNWTAFTNLTLTASVQVLYDFAADATATGQPQRFYRVVPGQP